MAVDQNLMELLSDPEKYIRNMKNKKCNSDAIKCLEAAISEDPAFKFTAYSYDRTMPQPYVCLTGDDEGAFLLCWNEDLTHIGFRVDKSFREFDPNDDVKQYCTALSKVIEREVVVLKQTIVNGFCEKLHYGSACDILEEFQKYIAETFRDMNSTRHTPIDQQYDLEELTLADEDSIKEVLERYCTVASDVHFA